MEGLQDLRRLKKHLAQFALTEPITTLQHYLKLRTQYLREKADDISEQDLKVNQGAIQELKEIQKIFETRATHPDYDGAFGA